MYKIVLSLVVIAVVVVFVFREWTSDRFVDNNSSQIVERPQSRPTTGPGADRINENIKSSAANAQEKQDEAFDYDLAGHVRKEISSNKIWPLVTDYSVTDEEIITKHQDRMGELVGYNQKLAANLSQCLELDYCGMTSFPNSAYFDPDNTPGHVLMARALALLKMAASKDASLLQAIEQEQFFSYLSSTNAEVRSNSLEILVKLQESSSSGNEIYERSLKSAKNFSGKSRTDFYAILNAPSQHDRMRREEYLLSIKKSMSGDDFYGSISLLENLDRIGLSEKELIEVTLPLCRIKTNDGDSEDGNWSTINNILTKRLGKKFNYCD
ncbi:MAG: hypothetical protein A2504_15460 [Bdellovibrionales bacterium RIFOXYD12_FULL_39_22]|nr:MAG: hypothetical protein A2385_02890 [Bdellovibrionales bacterium RIFOXYB1_FULL_39_21]OFZ43192.1 MAG: hypothetical protein A2485_12035 [Bdellovibrionales bacterium RIFOXYC12_FULL_39_17]OFZ47930.1 MAG: hypothetical protein A2404_16675 [Bdellovibrionales bacterium RIFOXYC1_FULL_39_130]OFZ74848.1 MAG: hypothetical protein A2451_03215 [Bdellovibrionales bacterium RIFOXYC2_FULL_39_8]OFZ75710.1 MAG: hypothetical protein A2560_13175 [Bdellovibrionales bacterium RIFOXYD1_FULL_39_84]OFZ94200.1 MAG: